VIIPEPGETDRIAFFFRRRPRIFGARIATNSLEPLQEKAMEPDSYFDPEVAVTALVVTAVASPPVRRWLRRGIVYAVTQILRVTDRMSDVQDTVRRGARRATKSVQRMAGSPLRRTA
jgi:hypothetical protein